MITLEISKIGDKCEMCEKEMFIEHPFYITRYLNIFRHKTCFSCFQIICNKVKHFQKIADIERKEAQGKRKFKNDPVFNPNDLGWIYLIKDVNNCYKLGRTYNIDNRISKYVTENSHAIHVMTLGLVRNHKKVEKYFLDKLSEYKIAERREWFKLSDVVVNLIKMELNGFVRDIS